MQAMAAVPDGVAPEDEHALLRSLGSFSKKSHTIWIITKKTLKHYTSWVCLPEPSTSGQCFFPIELRLSALLSEISTVGCVGFGSAGCATGRSIWGRLKNWRSARDDAQCDSEMTREAWHQKKPRTPKCYQYSGNIREESLYKQKINVWNT